MEVSLMAESSVEAAGGMMAFFNGVIEGGFSESQCACEVVDAGARAELMGWLEAGGCCSLGRGCWD